ncbi:protein FAR1-RELATED SEQUENCE 4-like [Rhododendron vialii]|uniref:protein FAR1-RELATED SEQUENCE 4-like n=1 Tax=Rhododendron vialii TaxID=182163 RepID=UPI00265EA347|nr:protein FAR1-RELATED SEQUENCE 4-like [Rhododendron vialii]
MAFDTSEDTYRYYLRYAREKRFAIAKGSSRKGSDGNLRHIGFECCHAGNVRVRTSNPVKPRSQTKIDFPAYVTVGIHPDGKWRLNTVVLKHNHEQSPGKARYFKCNRVLDEHVKRKLELNDKAEIKVYKTYDSLQIEAGGDAEVMHRYFMRMKANNSDFFFAMDLNEKGRLRNVFWANAKSRAVCKELGCKLISHEDTESFSWLFETWRTCMWGCAPKAMITDQCMAMKNALENDCHLHKEVSINSYFDGYIHSKTTLKQFVKQYENALANKVESESQEDVKNWHTYILLKKESVSEYEVKEWVTYGEGKKRRRFQVSFVVDLNSETNAAHCNCRSFEFRRMICRHQLTLWCQMGVERVPDKYIFRRWCKNVKRVYIKIRISYDKY